MESIRRHGIDGVAEVTLIGPGKWGNAMGPDFWSELVPLFGALDVDGDVRAVVLTGSGKNFSYGLDLPAMAGDFGKSSPTTRRPGADRVPRHHQADAGRHQRRR